MNDEHSNSAGANEFADIDEALARAAAQDTAQGDGWAETEHTLALRFADLAAHRLRWSGPLGWLTFDGHCWQRDSMRLHMAIARDICAAAPAVNAADEKRLRSHRTVAGVVALAQLDERLQVAPEAWDATPMVLNVPSGIVDLTTGALRPRSYADLVTQCTSTSPASSENCPRFFAFLAELFPHDDDGAMRTFLQRSCGHFLTGDRREQRVWLAIGAGANGKSTLLDLMAWMLGSYCIKLPASLFMASRNERHPTGLASLQGRRLAIASELESDQHFAEALLKETSGDDSLTARYLYKDFFTFRQSHKLIIVGNSKPRLHGGDFAMARRMLLIPFDARFANGSEDKTLPDKLRAEAPGILRWAINGCVAWLADGLAVPPAVAEATSEYLSAHDDLAQWMSERCRRLHEARAIDLYKDYSAWKRDRGENPASLTTWGERMVRLDGIERRRSAQGMRYLGISLLPPENEGFHYGMHRE